MNIIFFFLILFSAYARDPIPGSRFQQLSGVKVSQDSKTQWDQRYARPTFVFGKQAAEVVMKKYAPV